MQRLRTVTSLDVSAVAGHHAMPAALLYTCARTAKALTSLRRCADWCKSLLLANATGTFIVCRGSDDYLHKRNVVLLMDGWMFYALFNSISFISGRLRVMMKDYAVEPRLRLKRTQAGLEPGPLDQ